MLALVPSLFLTTPLPSIHSVPGTVVTQPLLLNFHGSGQAVLYGRGSQLLVCGPVAVCSQAMPGLGPRSEAGALGSISPNQAPTGHAWPSHLTDEGNHASVAQLLGCIYAVRPGCEESWAGGEPSSPCSIVHPCTATAHAHPPLDFLRVIFLHGPRL